MNELEWLQSYYLSLCDGYWEHSYGFEIGNLDNPGWIFEFEITDTPMQAVDFTELVVNRSDDDWIYCKVEEQKFVASCGPKNLTEVISIFRAWVANAR
jgi:Immunity protein 53